jgi:hypothetical protein
VQRHPPLLSGKPGYFGGFGNHRVLRLQHFQKFGWLPQMLRVFSEIRLVATNAPCPIHFAFCAKWVGNRKTQSDNFKEK